MIRSECLWFSSGVGLLSIGQTSFDTLVFSRLCISCMHSERNSYDWCMSWLERGPPSNLPPCAPGNPGSFTSPVAGEIRRSHKVKLSLLNHSVRRLPTDLSYCQLASCFLTVTTWISISWSRMTITTIPFPDKFDYSIQSIAVPGTKRPGQTGASHIFVRRRFINIEVFSKLTIGMVSHI
jgi:hypothetical protein